MLFDLKEGESLKEKGMASAAKNNSDTLDLARRVAKEIARASISRECCIDQVQEILIPLGKNLGMAAGSVFKEDCWEFTGKSIKTARVSSHARDVKVWVLREFDK